MTSVLYQILKCIDPKRQELVCGFLSHKDFEEIEDATAESLEALLQGVRRRQNLAYRGSFFRPEIFVVM